MHHILILLKASVFTDPLFSLQSPSSAGDEYKKQGIYRKERKEKKIKPHFLMKTCRFEKKYFKQWGALGGVYALAKNNLCKNT